jgi:predicted membrane protein
MQGQVHAGQLQAAYGMLLLWLLCLYVILGTGYADSLQTIQPKGI